MCGRRGLYTCFHCDLEDWGIGGGVSFISWDGYDFSVYFNLGPIHACVGYSRLKKE